MLGVTCADVMNSKNDYLASIIDTLMPSCFANRFHLNLTGNLIL